MAANLRMQYPAPAANPSGGPAALAAARVGRAGALLGALGLGCSLFVISRLVGTWRVTPGMSTHELFVFGQRLSYPAANLAAVVVVALALIGLVAAAKLVAGAVRELIASRRLHRWLARKGAGELDDVLVIADDRPRAFCAGLFAPRVYVSTGAIDLLDEVALSAVLAHERHHAHRRDPLRLATGRVIARGLFFVPGMRDLLERQSSLAELSADESSMNAAPDHRSALARAMLSFSAESRPGDPTGIEPERVDHLLGEAPTWRFPLLLFLLAGSALALAVAIGLLAGQVASGAATLAPPFLSRQPCVVVLAAIPAVVGLSAPALLRREPPVTGRPER